MKEERIARDNIGLMHLATIFIFVCLFDTRTVLLINALNAVICSPADPCLFVKWANLP